MLIIAICITVLSAYSSKLLVTGNQMQYVYPVMPSQAILPEYLQMSKRLTKAEPTCEELRIMWRYSKRQHRAIEITNQVPMFRDPFLYNVWEAPSRSPSPSTFRGTTYIFHSIISRTGTFPGAKMLQFSLSTHQTHSNDNIFNSMNATLMHPNLIPKKNNHRLGNSISSTWNSKLNVWYLRQR